MRQSQLVYHDQNETPKDQISTRNISLDIHLKKKCQKFMSENNCIYEIE